METYKIITRSNTTEEKIVINIILNTLTIVDVEGKQISQYNLMQVLNSRMREPDFRFTSFFGILFSNLQVDFYCIPVEDMVELYNSENSLIYKIPLVGSEYEFLYEIYKNPIDIQTFRENMIKKIGGHLYILNEDVCTVVDHKDNNIGICEVGKTIYFGVYSEAPSFNNISVNITAVTNGKLHFLPLAESEELNSIRTIRAKQSSGDGDDCKIDKIYAISKYVVELGTTKIFVSYNPEYYNYRKSIFEITGVTI